MKKLDSIPVVSSYAVTDGNIYVCDAFRGEVKCYTRNGAYVSAMPVEKHGGPIDIAVVPMRLTPQSKVFQPTLVTLQDSPITPSDPTIEWSRYQLCTYDLQTKKSVGHAFVHSKAIGFDDKGHEYHGSIFLHSSGADLGIVDLIKDQTFPMISDGRILNRGLENPTDGWGGFKAMDKMAVAADGTRYAMVRVVNDEALEMSIYFTDGRLAATGRRPKGIYYEHTFSDWTTYRILGESLFELGEDDAGIHVIEWK